MSGEKLHIKMMKGSKRKERVEWKLQFCCEGFYLMVVYLITIWDIWFRIFSICAEILLHNPISFRFLRCICTWVPHTLYPYPVLPVLVLASHDHRIGCCFTAWMIVKGESRKSTKENKIIWYRQQRIKWSYSRNWNKSWEKSAGLNVTGNGNVVMKCCIKWNILNYVWAEQKEKRHGKEKDKHRDVSYLSNQMHFFIYRCFSLLIPVL